MSWIYKKTEKIFDECDRENQVEILVNFANYWSELRSRIERDVAELNSNIRWKFILENHPIKVFGSNGDLHIKNSTMPSVNIYLTYRERKVEYEYNIGESGGTVEKQKEVMDVHFDQNRIYLTGREGSFLVPEEASEYVLDPVFKMLKMSKNLYSPKP